MTENTFAPLLKQMRTKAGITRKQLAELVGVSPRTVDGWETKRTPARTTRKLLELVLNK